MKDFNNFVLHSSFYVDAFDQLLAGVKWKQHHLEFMSGALTTSQSFYRSLLLEENKQQFCSATQASEQGEKVLLLLDKLYVLLDDNAQNHQLIIKLAVSTGAWIALRKGEIKELDLIVSGIAYFANQSANQQDLENLYEISLLVLYATDDYTKADEDKNDDNRPWRYLCLNHCIIATRTNHTELVKLSYERLISYLPEEAKNFFKMAMSQVNGGKYSPSCKELIQQYYQMYNHNSSQTQEMGIYLN